jgi:transposase
MSLTIACYAGATPTRSTAGSTTTNVPASPDSSSGLVVTGVFPPQRLVELVELVRQDPRLHGLAHARWRAADLQHLVPELAPYTPAGISKLLRRAGLRLKRGRLSRHSPDPAYAAKLAAIARIRAVTTGYPDRVRLLYADEVTLYRQPTLATIYAPVGVEPTSPLSYLGNHYRRYLAALDATSGRVTWLARSTLRVPSICAFLEAVRDAYPGQHLFLAWDNWIVHRHERVLATAARLNIHLVYLPTYAPWTNPIEKLWRWLRQDLVHHHQLADAWPDLQALTAAFLDQFDSGSPALLRYVGLLPE